MAFDLGLAEVDVDGQWDDDEAAEIGVSGLDGEDETVFMVDENFFDRVLQRIVLVYRALLEETLLEVEVELGYQLLLLIFLEDFGVVLESAEIILDLDSPSRIRCEVETFDVGFELAED